MSGEHGGKIGPGWAGRLAVLVSCAASAGVGWLCSSGIAGLLRDPLGAIPAVSIGVLAFLPAAFLGFALSLVVMSLLLALVIRTLPGNGSSGAGDHTGDA